MDVNALPDNILLNIFEYLSVRDLCFSGQVCRRWRRIVRDNSLWRHVNLLPYRLNLQRMWKVIRSHLSECLITMKIRGFMDSGKPKFSTHSLSNAMLKDLKERCPSMREIHLQHCNTENIGAEFLPGTLTTLKLEQCFWQPGWLKDSGENLESLVHLDVSRSVRFDDTDVQHLCKVDKLRVLIMNGCYRVSVTGLINIATSMKSLQRLEIADTSVKNTNQNLDLAIHHMTRNLSSLQCLNIAGCKELTLHGFVSLVIGLQKLQDINISACEKIDYDAIVHSLHHLKNIRKLTVCKSQMLGKSNEDLENLLLECSVFVEG